jgi:hypothetical protein
LSKIWKAFCKDGKKGSFYRKKLACIGVIVRIWHADGVWSNVLERGAGQIAKYVPAIKGTVSRNGFGI